MAEEQKREIDRPGKNGDNAGQPARDEAGLREEESPAAEKERGEEVSGRHLEDLTAAYERAKDELNQAVQGLRTELSKIDLDKTRERTTDWIKANPALAVSIGIGAGILAGRLLGRAFRQPPLPVRARRKAEALSDHAGEYAGELGEALAHYLRQAAQSVGEAGGFVARGGADAADKVGRRARSLGQDVSRTSERTMHVLEDAAEDLAEAVREKSGKARKQAKRGLHFSSAAMNVARTAVAAVVVKKLADLAKRVR